MKNTLKILATVILFATITVADALETARFTGKSEPVTTISGKRMRNCEYELRGGRTFWRIFETCSATIEVY